jgi:hypothetical protein
MIGGEVGVRVINGIVALLSRINSLLFYPNNSECMPISARIKISLLVICHVELVVPNILKHFFERLVYVLAFDYHADHAFLEVRD